ncbi:hypothetical protein [Halospeciosus flavus]|uniref:Uncharacterized protein n=1 Tax=Halospeciosus flavus TaxID=3032283 RepID=A0ABD5Z900_9EURY|nr:hypothetical protein [Halospeciosus flavus]
MSLDDLEDDVGAAYADLEETDFDLDRETRQELAMLVAALDPDEPDELVRRAVHMLFESTVQSGKLDFHLRSEYGVTYDEYLSGMTFDEMTGAAGGAGVGPEENENRRYQY